MRFALSIAAILLATTANAAPITQGLTVTQFFAQLEKLAKDLAEGGMDINRVHCTDDGTLCEAFYGAATTVKATGLSKTDGMEMIVVTQEMPGENNDFWLTSALVFEALEPDYLTIPERSKLILDAMKKRPGAEFAGNVGRYVVGRSSAGLFQMTTTAE